MASYLGEERCTKLFMPIVEEMAKDNVFYVRKEAAAAIGSIATVVNQRFVIEKLVSKSLAFVISSSFTLFCLSHETHLSLLFSMYKAPTLRRV